MKNMSKTCVYSRARLHPLTLTEIIFLQGSDVPSRFCKFFQFFTRALLFCPLEFVLLKMFYHQGSFSPSGLYSIISTVIFVYPFHEGPSGEIIFNNIFTGRVRALCKKLKNEKLLGKKYAGCIQVCNNLT